MTTLREAAQQALEALEDWDSPVALPAMVALKAALAEPTVKESLQVESAVAEIATTQQQLDNKPPSDYRRGYWDGFAIGKREGRIEAEDALAEPVQEPVAWYFEARAVALLLDLTEVRLNEPFPHLVQYYERVLEGAIRHPAVGPVKYLSVKVAP